MAKRRKEAPGATGKLICIDAIADRLVIMDLQGKFLEVNQSFLDFHGRRRDEIIGQIFLDMIADGDRERISKSFREALVGTGVAILEYRALTLSGEEIFSEIHGQVVRDSEGKPQKVVAVIRDVSNRKEAERELAKSEETYRTLLDSIHEAVFSTDAKGTLLFVSAGIERVSGFSPDELVGHNFIEFIWPEDVDFIRAQFQRLAMNELWPSEYRLRTKDGDYRWISSSSRPMFSNGRFSGINGILIDIHERRIAQEALSRQQELLLQAQKLEAIGTLAGGMAHDFNNLLMGIQGRVSLLLQEGVSSGPSAHAHLLDIEAHVRSASDLTRQLLGLARGGKYETHPCDLNELIRQTVDMFGRTRKDISIALDLHPGLWAAEVDWGQIGQVLLNLLVNAGQAMPKGGPLAIETRNLEVPEEVETDDHPPPGRWVRIGVSDAGVGMDEQTRSRIFDPFFTTKEMGRGLGLPSAYGIVKNHAGVITVHSETGSGTTFHVYLPATAKAVERNIKTGDEFRGGCETILLVDDEETILDVSRQMLESLGYQVLSANSGVQATEIYGKNRDTVDLIVLDMIMPKMDGGEVFNALKEIDSGARILLSSGYSINGQAMEIMERGCRGFIQKPFSIQELAHKLREILDG